MSNREIPEDIARRLRPLADDRAPHTSPALAAFLAAPVAPLTDNGDLAATTGHDVHGPVAAAAGQAAAPLTRRNPMKQAPADVFGALTRLSLVGKVALGAGAIAVAGMGSAAAVSAVVAETPAPPVVQAVADDSGDVSDPTVEPTPHVADEQGAATPATAEGDATALCAAATRHGEYVSWVARTTPRGPGHGLAVREAAHSDCGKTSQPAAMTGAEGTAVGDMDHKDDGDMAHGNHGMSSEHGSGDEDGEHGLSGDTGSGDEDGNQGPDMGRSHSAHRSGDGRTREVTESSRYPVPLALPSTITWSR